MKTYEWLNIEYILAKINERLSAVSVQLIEPYPTRELSYEEGTFWLIDLSGKIILKDLDLSEFSEGFNLLKSGELFEFEDFVTNACFGLFLKLGYGLDDD